MNDISERANKYTDNVLKDMQWKEQEAVEQLIYQAYYTGAMAQRILDTNIVSNALIDLGWSAEEIKKMQDKIYGR